MKTSIPTRRKSLRDHGFEVECLKGALSEDELIDALEGVDLLGIRSKTSVTRKVIDARPTLTAVGCFCIGTNQVDLEYAGKNGIAVFNAPYSNTRSVVELVIGDIICLMRRIPAHTHHMKHGMWDKSASGSHEVRGKTLGIIGYGNIGSQLSVVAEALGMRVLFYDIEEKLAMGNAHRCDTLNELLEQSDGHASCGWTQVEHGILRRRPVRAYEAGCHLHQPVLWFRGGFGCVERSIWIPAICPARRWTCSQSNRRRPATSS